MDSTYLNADKKRGITHNSKTSSSKVFIQNLTNGHLEFMQIAYSSRLGSQPEFVLGPDESKSTKTFIGRNILGSLLNTCDCQMDKLFNVSLCDTLWVR